MPRFLLLACGLLGFAVLPAAPARPYYAAAPGALEKSRQKLAAGDKDTAAAVKKLLGEADKLLAVAPPSVTEKKKTPPSGDKHDYVSLAPYFWPDPSKKDGLPYIRKDGKVNPESRDEEANDTLRMRLFGSGVETLALAYYFSHDEKYAAHAAAFLRTWCLDPATRMNPSLNFAQAVRGKNDGRGTGILESRVLGTVADATVLLDGSAAWKATDQKAFDQWAGAFLDWLLASAPGKDERAAKNNHGSWFDVQAAELALSLGRREEAQRILAEVPRKRIAVQVEPDGRQPMELARTNSFSYSCFNIEALTELANFGQHLGVDLWQSGGKDGRTLRKALDYLLPYLDRPAKPWPGEQLKEARDTDMLPVLRQAALACRAPEYEAIVAKFPEARGKRFQLLFPAK